MNNDKAQKIILLIVCIAVLIVQIDTSVVNLTIKHIGTNLNATVTQLQWVIDAYNLMYASFLLTGAILGEVYGHKRIFTTGTVIFIIGSLICGFSNNVEILIFGRLIAGFGAALMLPVSLSIIAVTFKNQKDRNKAIGLWASCNGIAFIIGPTLGGWLVEAIGWRSIFFVAIPFGILAVLGSILKINNSHHNTNRKLDFIGQLFAVIFIGFLTILAIEVNEWGWLSQYSIGCYIIIILSLILFIKVESGNKNALIPLDFFTHKTLTSSLIIAFLMTFGMYALLFIVPIYFLSVLELNTMIAGIALLPMSVSFVLVSQKANLFIEKLNYRKTMMLGMFLMSLGTLLMALFLTNNSLWLIEFSLLIIGIGVGLNTAPVLSIALLCVEHERSGTVSGIINTTRMLGATLGVAIIGSVFSKYNNSVNLTSQAIEGFSKSFLIAAIFLFIGVIMVYLFIDNEPKRL